MTWPKLWVVMGTVVSLVFGVGLVVQQLHAAHPHDGSVSEKVFREARTADAERHQEILRRLDRIEQKIDK